MHLEKLKRPIIWGGGDTIKKIADQYGRNKSRPTHLIHVRKKSPNYTRLTSGTSDNNEAIYNAVAADAPRKNGMSVST